MRKDAERSIGFVERELRYFDLEDCIHDLIGDHKAVNHLVWSRGHSIENYFFEQYFANCYEIIQSHYILKNASTLTSFM